MDEHNAKSVYNGKVHVELVFAPDHCRWWQGVAKTRDDVWPESGWRLRLRLCVRAANHALTCVGGCSRLCCVSGGCAVVAVEATLRPRGRAHGGRRAASRRENGTTSSRHQSDSAPTHIIGGMEACSCASCHCCIMRSFSSCISCAASASDSRNNVSGLRDTTRKPASNRLSGECQFGAFDALLPKRDSQVGDGGRATSHTSNSDECRLFLSERCRAC